MPKTAPTCHDGRMSFDENPPSPSHVVNPEKKTTKVNMGVVAGVIVFLMIAVGALIWVMKDPPQSPPTPVSSP